MNTGTEGGMRRRACLGLASAVLAAATCLMPHAGNSEPVDRVADAKQRREGELRAMFEKGGIRWPAEEIFVRAMKREAQLELWARNAPGEAFRLVKTYPVLTLSGVPGPKRREGDLQVPEGFYEITRFNPRSSFHLSLGLNYPNASDRVLSDRKAPGSDIFIHGRVGSIGCLAMGDPAIEEIYLALQASRARPIQTHFFPARMNAPDWPAWRDAELQKRPELRAFWEQLAVGWECFEREHRLPKIEVGSDGAYRCKSQGSAK